MIENPPVTGLVQWTFWGILGGISYWKESDKSLVQKQTQVFHCYYINMFKCLHVCFVYHSVVESKFEMKSRKHFFSIFISPYFLLWILFVLMKYMVCSLPQFGRRFAKYMYSKCVFFENLFISACVNYLYTFKEM